MGLVVVVGVIGVFEKGFSKVDTAVKHLMLQAKAELNPNATVLQQCLLEKHRQIYAPIQPTIIVSTTPLAYDSFQLSKTVAYTKVSPSTF